MAVFASSSVGVHLLRGLFGMLALFGGLVGALAVTPVFLVLVPAGFVLLRGCPMCWTVGLAATIAGAGERRGGCAAGRCR
jgi:hypothetical protein